MSGYPTLFGANGIAGSFAALMSLQARMLPRLLGDQGMPYGKNDPIRVGVDLGGTKIEFVALDRPRGRLGTTEKVAREQVEASAAAGS